MKKVIEHWGSPSVNSKQFKCNSCWCRYFSTERYEEYWITQDECPECESHDTKEV